jgi:CHAT domain-containing protein/tetratricopeptide (TPR) repeat protein
MNATQIVDAAKHLAGITSAGMLREELARQPGLFAPEVDSLLTRAIQEETDRGEPQQVCTLLAVRAFLADCQVHGEEIALPPDLILPLSDACPLPALARQVRDPAPTLQHVELCRRALDQLRRETEPTWWATTQCTLAKTLARLEGDDRTANLRKAAACLEAALDVWREQQLHGEWAETMADLAWVWEDYALLDPAYRMGEAIDFFERMLGEIDPSRHPQERARLLHTLGNLYCQWPEGDRAENIDRAKIYYEVAFCICDKTRKENPKHWAYTRIGLSNAYLWRVRGDPTQNVEQAIEGYRAAQEAWPREGIGETWAGLDTRSHKSAQETWAEVEYNLAVAYRLRRLGSRPENIEQAIHHARQALQFFREETFPRQWATIKSELAALYSQRARGDARQNLEDAIDRFESALKVFTSEGTPVQWARAHDGLGNTLMDRLEGDPADNVDRAIQHYRQALEARTREHYPKEWAETLNNLGTAYTTLWARGQASAAAQAASCYIAALAVRKPDTLPAGARQTARNLGQLYFYARAWSRACDTFATALQAAETLYRASFTRPGKGAELAENAALYPDAAYTAARLGDPERAFLILEQGKTRLLAEALRLRVPRPAEVGGDAWQTFEDAAASVRSAELHDVASLGRDLGAVQAAAQRERAAQQAQDALARAIDRVREDAPDFLQDLDLRAIRSLLPDERTALVAFCITHQGSIGLLVHGWQQDAVQMVDVPAFTKRTLDGLLFGSGAGGNLGGGWVGEYQNRPLEDWRPLMERVLAKVGKKLLDPILEAVPPCVDHLIFLPSGGLFLLPLHAAPLSGMGAGRVCDRFQVTYAPSAGVLSSLPALETAPKRYGLIATVNRPDMPLLKFAPLEGIVIGRLLARRLHLEDAGATRRDFVRGARERAYLHFAGHGIYDWDDPPQSGLCLADRNLTLTDLQRGHLGLSSGDPGAAGSEGEPVDLSAARLVTLSACETGIADVVQGSADEYLSLPAGFMRAGVPCVVSSLWQVEDLSAVLLMERFYRNHLAERMAPGLALHEAQSWMCTRLTQNVVLETIDRWQELCKQAKRDDLNQHLEGEKDRLNNGDGRDPDARPYTHPFYWAAFTVTGR